MGHQGEHLGAMQTRQGTAHSMQAALGSSVRVHLGSSTQALVSRHLAAGALAVQHLGALAGLCSSTAIPRSSMAMLRPTR